MKNNSLFPTFCLVMLIYISFIFLTSKETEKSMMLDLNNISVLIEQDATHSNIVMKDGTVYNSNKSTLQFIKDISNYRNLNNHRYLVEKLVENGVPLIEMNSFFGTYWVVDKSKIREWTTKPVVI